MRKGLRFRHNMIESIETLIYFFNRYSILIKGETREAINILKET